MNGLATRPVTGSLSTNGLVHGPGKKTTSAGMNKRDRKIQLQEAVIRNLKADGRKKQKRLDPNDRGTDHKLMEKIKRLRPEDLSKILNDDPE